MVVALLCSNIKILSDEKLDDVRPGHAGRIRQPPASTFRQKDTRHFEDVMPNYLDASDGNVPSGG